MGEWFAHVFSHSHCELNSVKVDNVFNSFLLSLGRVVCPSVPKFPLINERCQG